MGILEFLKENRKFWSALNIREGGPKLLIEEARYAPSSHGNALYALVLNKARGYMPAWLDDGEGQGREFLQSYIPGAEVFRSRNYSLWDKAAALFFGLKAFFLLSVTGRVLGERGVYYDGVYYGDIVYDIYLGLYEVATVKRVRFNFGFWKMIALIILRHREIRKILLGGNFAGVLAAHQVGIEGGVMLRTALRYGALAFLSAEMTQLQCYSSLDQVYDYEFKAFPADVDRIVLRLGENLEKVFQEVLKKQVSGFGDWDSQQAFSAQHAYFDNRQKFNAQYGLDSAKKNIFVMIHVFNDHPHAHFRWMIFNDFYDWLAQTLAFAKKYDKVNWIFKQHPSMKFYTVRDVNLKKVFANLPANIIFIDEDQQINTHSVIYCADAVITCFGSAGFELPAMAGIPSITAGDNFYSGLGFASEPKNKREYFEALGNLNEIQRLPAQLQRRAQAAFIHIYKFARIFWASWPKLTIEQQKDPEINQWYWDKVLELYREKKPEIWAEIENYASIISDPNFKRFNNFESFCKERNL